MKPLYRVVKYGVHYVASETELEKKFGLSIKQINWFINNDMFIRDYRIYRLDEPKQIGNTEPMSFSKDKYVKKWYMTRVLELLEKGYKPKNVKDMLGLEDKEMRSIVAALKYRNLIKKDVKEYEHGVFESVL